MMKKFRAFTLSEILIALSVIGVVAALVLPSLLVGQKAAKTKAQFNTAYALISKSITDMDSDDVSIDPNDYDTRAFYAKYKLYNKVSIDCGVNYGAANTSVCPAGQSYKNLTGSTSIHNQLLDDGGFVLTNGMTIAIENCRGCSPYNTTVDGVPDHNIWIIVDVNGYDNTPNKVGYDMFIFQLTKDGILPLGAPGTDKKFSDNPAGYCCDQAVNKGCSVASANMNGFTCAYFASTDENYFTNLYRGH